MPPAIAVKVMAVRCCPNSTIATSTPPTRRYSGPSRPGCRGVTHQRLEYRAADAKRRANQIAIATRGSRHSVTTMVMLRGALPVRA